MAVEVLDDGRARISWYTSESATELIKLNGENVQQDDFATKKNHEFITEPLSIGEWTLEVFSLDASGNSNSTSLTFTVDDVEITEDNQETTDNDKEEEESTESGVSSTSIQIGVLFVLLVLIVAFIRVSNNDNSEDDKWS